MTSVWSNHGGPPSLTKIKLEPSEETSVNSQGRKVTNGATCKDLPLLLPPALAKAAQVGINEQLKKFHQASGNFDRISPRFEKAKPTRRLSPKSLEERLAKKQKRLIRNRVSAQLHRERKKQHLASLESKVKELLKKNCSLQEQVQGLKKENMELKEKLARSDLKLRQLEDLAYAPQDPSIEAKNEIINLDFEETYNLLDSPESYSFEWTSSLDGEDSTGMGSSSETRTSSSDSEDSSVSNENKRRKQGSRTLPLFCLAAFAFAVSIFGDSTTVENRSVVPPSPPRLLSDMVAELDNQDVNDTLMLPYSQDMSELDSAFSQNNSTELTAYHQEEYSDKQRALLQLALKYDVESVSFAEKNGSLNLDFKNAVWNEIVILTKLFEQASESTTHKANEETSNLTASTSLVVHNRDMMSSINETRLSRLHAARAVLSAYISYVGGSTGSDELFESFIMCPSAYGVLNVPSRRKGFGSSQANPRLRKTGDYNNNTNLTLVVPSHSLYGSEINGVVQLHCQVDRISNFLQ